MPGTMTCNVGARSGVLACVALGIIFASACRPQVEFRMVSPQVSTDNRYIGLDVELMFGFEEDRFFLEIVNTGRGEVLLGWEQATFVGPDGVAIQLVSAGPQLTRTIPEGSRARVLLTLVSFTHPKPPIWHRRSDRKQHLVHPLIVKQCRPRVRVALPSTRYTSEGVSSETLQFEFEVRLDRETNTKQGEPANVEAWDI